MKKKELLEEKDAPQRSPRRLLSRRRQWMTTRISRRTGAIACKKQEKKVNPILRFFGFGKKEKKEADEGVTANKRVSELWMEKHDIGKGDSPKVEASVTFGANQIGCSAYY
ncbi:hypothetical protein QR680_012467 [Steinernema hermaphroditum]|nr:hypothetical protein QR680_012467 [Steinernema hermaphroditum]